MVFDKYCKAVGIERAVALKAPTFHDVTKSYGEDATAFWMRYHIAETFLFVGIYDQASKYQIRHTAELILEHEIYGQLTLSEFLCFLQRFKQGRYERIYNSNHPNPQEFLRCLKPFWEDLMAYRGRQREKELIEEMRKKEQESHPISWEEYCRRTGQEGRKNPLTSINEHEQ